MSETNFFWDPLSDNILQERDETGAVTAGYTTEPGLYGNLISQSRGGAESQYHFDVLGSPLALTDDSQQVTDTNAYSAFGEVTEHSGSTVNSFQFIGQKGYYHNVEIGNYLVRRRLLSVEGRWLSPDPIRTTSNPFVYCHNNALTCVDPSGLRVCHILVFGGHGATVNPDGTVGEIGGWIEIQIEKWEKSDKLRCDVIAVGPVCCFSKQICKKHSLPELTGIPLHDRVVFITKSEMLKAIATAKAAAKGFCNTKVCDDEVCDRISVHVACDADMKKVLGSTDAKKYCGTYFVFDCKKQDWDP